MNFLEKLLDLHRRRRWLTHLLFWAAVLLVSVSSSKYYDGKAGGYGFEFASDFFYMIPEMLAAYLVAYVVMPKLIYRRMYLTGAVAFLLIAYLASALGRVFIVKVDEPLAGIAPKAFETYGEILTDIPKLLYVYFFQIFAVVFLFICLKTLKDQALTRQRALVLEKEKTETELKLLKAQLNPHFLFNTLNNIYSLSFTSQERTSASIARLADILDHILYRSHERSVPISAEVDLIRNYIELERLRYDRRLTVNFRVEVVREVEVAPLVMLSLVENAFKHGASNDLGEPAIDIYLQVSGGRLRFEVSNTVRGGEVPTGKTRIGLDNLRRQLHHLYGTDHELAVSREGDRFVVRLSIELKQNSALHEKDTMFIGR